MVMMPDWKAAGAFFIPPPTFSVVDIPDLTGKVAIVTGANVGIGRETARVLASRGAKVYLACRSEEKARQTIAELKHESDRYDVHFLALDLENMQLAHHAAKAFSQLERRLDILLLNAGVVCAPTGSVSAQGCELHFAVNVIGHAAFAKALEPLLVQTALTNKKPASVRVVWVSSAAHYGNAPKEGIILETITNAREMVKYSPMTLYGQSKLGTVIMAKRLAEYGILVTSLHPGVIQSDASRHMNFVIRFFAKRIPYPVGLGAITSLYAATCPSLTIERDSGAYFVPWARKHHPSHEKATDEAMIEQMVKFVNDILEKHLHKAAPPPP